MADIIVMRDWLENKVNILAQKYKCFKDTKANKNVEEQLKKAGVQLANHNMHCLHHKRIKDN